MGLPLTYSPTVAYKRQRQMACAGRHIVELSQDANPLLLVSPILFALEQAPGQKGPAVVVVIHGSIQDEAPVH